jgi:glycosyltransferase involved in cell wall biosynthesis
MSNEGMVSVIIPFLNAARFFEETIDSVLGQSYANWELLLVDDGSSDASTQMARDWAQSNDRIFFFEHPGHENRGASASRNLGIHHARGEFIAFLDADDVWLPGKLERQVAIMASHPEAAMVYGVTKIWYSWSGVEGTADQDYKLLHHIPSDRLMEPPDLLRCLLSPKAPVPCTCAILIRRDKALSVGNMEESFPGLYDDQVFYAKLCLHYPVFVSSACDDLYRQHPDSMCATISKKPAEVEARRKYLYWIADLLRRHSVADQDLWQRLARQIWLTGESDLTITSMRQWNRWRWIRKQCLRFERYLIPTPCQSWIWAGKLQKLCAAPPPEHSG